MCEIKTYQKDKVFYTAIRCEKIDTCNPFTGKAIIDKLKCNAKSNKVGNWSNSLYLSVDNDTISLGQVVAYEVSPGKLIDDSFYIFKLILKNPLQYIDCNLAQYENGVVSEEVVGKEIFANLKIDGNVIGEINGPFMSALGEKGIAFECANTKIGETSFRECIIPSNLISNHLEVVSYQKLCVNAKGEIFFKSDYINIDLG